MHFDRDLIGGKVFIKQDQTRPNKKNKNAKNKENKWKRKNNQVG
jgi:hypothetical protein